LSIFISVYISACLYSSFFLSVSLSLCLSVSLSLCLSVSLSISHTGSKWFFTICILLILMRLAFYLIGILNFSFTYSLIRPYTIRIISARVFLQCKLTPFFSSSSKYIYAQSKCNFQFYTDPIRKQFFVLCNSNWKSNKNQFLKRMWKKSIFFVLWLLKFHYKLLWTLEKALGNDRVTSHNCTLFGITCQHQLFDLMITFSKIKTKKRHYQMFEWFVLIV